MDAPGEEFKGGATDLVVEVDVNDLTDPSKGVGSVSNIDVRGSDVNDEDVAGSNLSGWEELVVPDAPDAVAVSPMKRTPDEEIRTSVSEAKKVDEGQSGNASILLDRDGLPEEWDGERTKIRCLLCGVVMVSKFWRLHVQARRHKEESQRFDGALPWVRGFLCYVEEHSASPFCGVCGKKVKDSGPHHASVHLGTDQTNSSTSTRVDRGGLPAKWGEGDRHKIRCILCEKTMKASTWRLHCDSRQHLDEARELRLGSRSNQLQTCYVEGFSQDPFCGVCDEDVQQATFEHIARHRGVLKSNDGDLRLEIRDKNVSRGASRPEKKLDRDGLPRKWDDDLQKHRVRCILCKATVNATEWALHCDSREHREEARGYPSDQRRTCYVEGFKDKPFCGICGEDTEESTLEHIRLHRALLTSKRKDLRMVAGTTSTPHFDATRPALGSGTKLDRDGLPQKWDKNIHNHSVRCMLCKATVNATEWALHCDSREHREEARGYPSDQRRTCYVEGFKSKPFCGICGEYTDQPTLDHMSKHQSHKSRCDLSFGRLDADVSGGKRHRTPSPHARDRDRRRSLTPRTTRDRDRRRSLSPRKDRDRRRSLSPRTRDKERDRRRSTSPRGRDRERSPRRDSPDRTGSKRHRTPSRDRDRSPRQHSRERARRDTSPGTSPTRNPPRDPPSMVAWCHICDSEHSLMDTKDWDAHVRGSTHMAICQKLKIRPGSKEERDCRQEIFGTTFPRTSSPSRWLDVLQTKSIAARCVFCSTVVGSAALHRNSDRCILFNVGSRMKGSAALSTSSVGTAPTTRAVASSPSKATERLPVGALLVAWCTICSTNALVDKRDWARHLRSEQHVGACSAAKVQQEETECYMELDGKEFDKARSAFDCENVARRSQSAWCASCRVEVEGSVAEHRSVDRKQRLGVESDEVSHGAGRKRSRTPTSNKVQRNANGTPNQDAAFSGRPSESRTVGQPAQTTASHVAPQSTASTGVTLGPDSVTIPQGMLTPEVLKLLLAQATSNQPPPQQPLPHRQAHPSGQAAQQFQPPPTHHQLQHNQQLHHYHMHHQHQSPPLVGRPPAPATAPPTCPSRPCPQMFDPSHAMHFYHGPEHVPK